MYSSNSAGQTCISCSMSGILLEYWTVGAGLDRFNSSIRFTQFSISLGFFSAFSIDRTSIGWRSWFLLRDRSWRSRMEGSVGFIVGSSRQVVPRLLWALSGLGILMKASTSPMLGISSGMKGFKVESSSMVCGLYLVMYWKSSSTSDDTDRCLNSSGLYAFADSAALPSPPPSPALLESEVLPDSSLLDSSSLPSSSSGSGLGAFCGEPLPIMPCGVCCWLLGDGTSELAGVLTSSSSVSTAIASS
mmetsp:Transcript_7293/g.16545  ORF Transcript_7293/g.16545 Transcript_7293/m.16545 type:complete len:246 (-) Transcript_7293:160-897(-)